MTRIRDRLKNQEMKGYELEHQIIKKMQVYLNNSFDKKMIEVLDQLEYLKIGSYSISLYEVKNKISIYYLTQNQNNNIVIVGEMYVGEEKDKIYIYPIKPLRAFTFLDEIENKDYLNGCIERNIKDKLQTNQERLEELNYTLEKLVEKGY